MQIKCYYLFLMYFFVAIVHAAEPLSPAGLWKALDDKGVPTGFVKFTENQGVFTGVIEKSLETDTEEQYCTACKDARKDQRLVGMTIMKNVKAKGDAYEGTEILDPFSGNTYRVKLTLKEAGKKMEVRGFAGLSLFGRTQVWQRTE
jgi:uncharacterized protein (DUF2147 family)